MTDSRPANHRYYARNEGAWISALDFRITDWSAFWSTSMPLGERLQVLSIVTWPSFLFGPIYFETDVDYASTAADGRVGHWTRVKKFGMVMMAAEEVFTLHDDGVSVGIEGSRRALPWFWRTEGYAGSSATVDPDAAGATYVFPWFGTVIDQTTRNVEGGCDITQKTLFSVGVQRLRRR